MSDTYTPFLGLTKPDVGASDDTWGEKLNANFDILDNAISTGSGGGEEGSQPLDATLTALAALNAVPGLVEQTGADAFAKRPIGVGTSASIPTRADGDARYAGIAHSHVASNISDFSEAVDDRVSSLLVAGTNISLAYNDALNTLTVNSTGGGSSLTDGDKGEITVASSGSVWTIDNGVVTLAKLATDATNAITGKVAKAGDVMTGSLTVSGAPIIVSGANGTAPPVLNTTGYSEFLNTNITSGAGGQLWFSAVSGNPYATLSGFLLSGPSPYEGSVVFSIKPNASSPLRPALWLRPSGELFWSETNPASLTWGGNFMYSGYSTRKAGIAIFTQSNVTLNPSDTYAFYGVGETIHANHGGAGAYLEGRTRIGNMTSAAEIDVANYSGQDPQIGDPNNPYGNPPPDGTKPYTVAIMSQAYGSDTAPPLGFKDSSTWMQLFHIADPDVRYRKGIIFSANTLRANSGNIEAINFPVDYQIAWYTAGGVVGRLSSANSVALTWNGATLATLTNKLSDFAATTSAELKNVISDETGSGALVFANSPTLVTPNIGVATATSINGVTLDNNAWASYTPTPSAQTGSFTTASATGRFKQIGKTVFFQVEITITTNGTAAGTVKATLPVTNSGHVYGGIGGREAASGLVLIGYMFASSGVVDIIGRDGSYPGANGRVVIVSGMYEAA